jgi:hypothetical protein
VRHTRKGRGETQSALRQAGRLNFEYPDRPTHALRGPNQHAVLTEELSADIGKKSTAIKPKTVANYRKYLSKLTKTPHGGSVVYRSALKATTLPPWG